MRESAFGRPDYRTYEQGAGLAASAIFHRAARVSVLFSLAILVLIPGAAGAAVTHATARPLVWLKTRDYSALEHYYSHAQRQFESGKLNGQQLYARFRKLYQDSASNERYFDGWVRRHPHSYSARVARGAYLYRMAWYRMEWFRRSYGYRGGRAEQHFAVLREYLLRAQSDLRASLRMTAKPYLSALYLLNVSILDGSSSDCEHWLRRGDTIDPTNYLVRLRYMFCLLPWQHGSYAQMIDFLRQSVAQPLDSHHFEFLALFIRNTLVVSDVPAREFRSVSHELMEVLRLAVQAHQKAPTGFLVAYTYVAWNLRLPADVMWGLRHLSKSHLNDAWGMSQIGWIYAEAHRYYKAWPLFTRAAALNDPWSQLVVGLTIYNGCSDLNLPANRSLGLVWIKRSANQCFSDADLFMGIHGRGVAARCSNTGGRRPSSATGALVALLESIAISITHNLVTNNVSRSP